MVAQTDFRATLYMVITDQNASRGIPADGSKCLEEGALHWPSLCPDLLSTLLLLCALEGRSLCPASTRLPTVWLPM